MGVIGEKFFREGEVVFTEHHFCLWLFEVALIFSEVENPFSVPI